MQSLVIVGEHLVMRKVAELAERLASTRHPVLIGGEKGTGRRLIASVLHERGPRRAAPFVVVDCSAVARSERSLRAARFAAAAKSARGGTLFLKDVEWLDEALQQQAFAALTAPRGGDVRLVMSCARGPVGDPQGELFPGLAARLGALRLFLPPLRERRCDIVALLEHFIALCCGTEAPMRVDEGVVLALWRYDWPGNVRQLRDEVARAVEHCAGNFLHRECFSASVCGREGGPGPTHRMMRRAGVPKLHLAPAWAGLRTG
jgi:DNA-binding NtrC family response regulator